MRRRQFVGILFMIAAVVGLTEEIERADEIQVVLSHLSVLFPYPGWIGFRSANVSLRN